MAILRLHGHGAPDHLDPACSHHIPTRQLLRLYTRQLFTYQPDMNLRNWQAIAPVPDLATAIPSIYNAGLGASGRSYVVHLRPGVRWDTTPPRPLTAHDVVRGLKRLAGPTVRNPALPFFTSTIRGMAEYHREFAAAAPDGTAEQLARFQNTHEIAGVFALDDESLVIELLRPTLDIVDILALPCASPAPAEYDAFVPDSPEFREHIRSLGPYRPVPGSIAQFEPNPVWDPASDPVRQRRLSAIRVIPSTGDTAAAAVRSGAADLTWNVPVTAAATAVDLGSALDPCLLFNMRRDDVDLAVRRAVAGAIDRETLAGPGKRAAYSIIPPGNDGHQETGPAVPAGSAAGTRLRMLHAPTDAMVANAVAADLAKVGITVTALALEQAELRATLADPAAEWDMTLVSWSPDWFHNNARVFLQRMFQSDAPGNYGGYSSPEVDALIDEALAELQPLRAVTAWQRVENRVLADVAVVPLLFNEPSVPALRGDRVRDARPMPAIGFGYDLATLELATPT
ncbi:hypothetical protein ALI144C_37635 [Actinosynnema sp. ALI-1.44]|uniref:ABC transporter substrate-binding protein n=1 Tax=Actinosynnema sp. ALI-1.44 TaxID=1933779 RepID=UPI00097BF872|nr:ABC transporter substrate-binding protein [Actinosynnema sp. ALI-1.44]ONI76371.1 hypothetical protein ALI144C_37635 [Actinosynnema sp. ALI-1.44]